MAFTGFDADGGRTEEGELRIAYSSISDRTYIINDQTSFSFFLDGDYQHIFNEDDVLF